MDATLQPDLAQLAASGTAVDTIDTAPIEAEDMATQRPRGLGTGLAALLPDSSSPTGRRFRQLDLATVHPNPDQPRRTFDEAAIVELADSITAIGLLQPILVTAHPNRAGHHIIIAGERRWRAHRHAGLDHIDAIVDDGTDNPADIFAAAITENLHRQDLPKLEEAAAYAALRDDLGCTITELADRLGRSRQAISAALSLLDLPDRTKQLLNAGTITVGHVKALRSLSDPDRIDHAARRVAAEQLSVRDTEQLVRTLSAPRRPQRATPATTKGPYPDLRRKLADELGTKVTLTGKPERGQITIDWAGTEDLRRILELLAIGLDQAA